MNHSFVRPMMESLVIERNQPKLKALDHEALYLAGVEYVQAYCGKIWTDYNVHDPGMTILELLSYVLTDVAFRASSPIADVLASGLGSNDLSDQFHSAAQVFTNQALTVNDYRKLLIDVPNVENAWVLPVQTLLHVDKSKAKLLFAKPANRKTEQVEIQGINRVVLDLSESASAVEKKLAEEQARQRLMAHRNLCEDWTAIERIRKQNFFLCGGIELEVYARPDQVYAEILFAVQNYLTPVIKRYSLTEMLDLRHGNREAYTTNEIFSGPWLENGFITDESLTKTQLKTEIRLSDIIGLIMDIDGVSRVRKLHISPSGITFDDPADWLVPVKSDHKPILNPGHSRLEFFVDDLPVNTVVEKVVTIYKALKNKVKQVQQAIKTEDLPVPGGRQRKIREYFSIQNHFPAVYGVGSLGLQAQASIEEKNRVRQFKGYLLFFDQVLANFTAQLTHLASLFSSDQAVTESYAFQLVSSFKDYEEIYALPVEDDPVSRSTRIQVIKQLFIKEGDELDRRNRFLDHLIARFGEQTSDFAAALVNMFDANAQTLVRYKCNFINRFPEISRMRGTAFNYALNSDGQIWDTNNISGLEKRLAALLGLENSARRNLSNIPIDQGVQILGNDQDGFRFHIRDQANQLLLSSPTTKFVDRVSVEVAVRMTLVAASDSGNYVRKAASNGKHLFELVDGEQVLTRRSKLFEKQSERDAAIDAVIKYVRTHHSNEGLFLVENILLRPQAKTEPTMPVCVDINSVDCAQVDPYSYRMHIILPAYAGRFRNMEFRNYVENVIRRETPAHILPKICWADREEIELLEVSLQHWHQRISGDETVARNEVMQLVIDQLFETKSVFPVERLVDCDEKETASRFVVGKTMLGTLDIEED